MRKPFQLRSGNGMSGSSFKMMGASPMKELIGGQKNLDLNNNNKVDGQDLKMLREQGGGDSPVKLARAGWKLLKYGYRKLMGTTKTKVRGTKTRSFAEESKNITQKATKNYKKGDLISMSKGTRDKLTQLHGDIETFNKAIRQDPIKYTTKDAVIDLALTAGGAITYYKNGKKVTENEVDWSGAEIYDPNKHEKKTQGNRTDKNRLD
tara:strand:- start:1194 stop:1814 length:621 start_codon:yes stop_codon:yes gene_type:complete